MNVNVGGNRYSILPSREDTYYIMVNMSDTKLVMDPDLVGSSITLVTRTLPGEGLDDKMNLQTRLVEAHGQLYCPNKQLVAAYTQFYVSTFISALIHDNHECIAEICNDR